MREKSGTKEQLSIGNGIKGVIEMSMDKAIEHGKEHRKPWGGSANSKNFDKTCRNHGSCDYCKFNRLHTFMKNDSAAKSKLKEWEE